ncbi:MULTISPECIES: hypothetical protein [Moorena]|nr:MULTISPECIES: hypothetical protein [Moorena]NEQ13043.1 hypothetical protein [Moorena sp. SIO3E2]NEP31362.1 hypothetical protein [Moorena sp. SIO3B2]NEP66530.1 hypothetical protein [Moorena sp. SIO3A5]NEQ05656.1 hypothetical protein [Moorena sp. SIO4E2]NER86288.1 hypothetical protein [Moorena sp. SIO3A2]
MQHKIFRGLDPGNRQSGIRQPLPIQPDPLAKGSKNLLQPSRIIGTS